MAISTNTIWLIIGFVGQSLFFTRFLVQWLHSEKHKRSIVPAAFWYFSIVGGLISLAYAIYREDPVFIAGNSIGVFVYLRNLYFIVREKKEKNGNGNVVV